MHHGTCEWQQTDPQWFEPAKELGSPCSPWRLRSPPGLATNQPYWTQTPHLERDTVKLHTHTHLQESKHTRHNTHSRVHQLLALTCLQNMERYRGGGDCLTFSFVSRFPLPSFLLLLLTSPRLCFDCLSRWRQSHFTLSPSSPSSP